MCHKLTHLRLGVAACSMALLLAGCPVATESDWPGDGEATSGATDKMVETRYVTITGDDGADGLSAETALRTISEAARRSGPGDTVIIASGTYTESVSMTGFGSAAAATTFRGEGTTPVLNGEAARRFGFFCENCTNVVFENIEVRNFRAVGVLVLLSENVTLNNLVVHNNGMTSNVSWVEGYGIHAEDSTNVTIENNEVFENGPNPQVLGRWLGTGIDTFNLTDSVIRGNRSYDNVGGGLLVEDSTGVLVSDNEFTGNNLDATIEEWWDGAIWVDGGRDITLRNNAITDNIGPGIQISNEDHQSPTGYVLEGNTVTGNRWGLFVWNFGTGALPTTDILDVRDDNRIFDNTEQDLWIVPWIEGD